MNFAPRLPLPDTDGCEEDLNPSDIGSSISNGLRSGVQRRADAPILPSQSPEEMEPMLTISARQSIHLLMVELTGMLDRFTAPDLWRTLQDIPGLPLRIVALDMSRVDHVDEEGYGALINLQKRLVDAGQRLVLINCQSSVQQALALTRWDILLPTYPDAQSLQRIL
jgi:anti-anti-sigma factor